MRHQLLLALESISEKDLERFVAAGVRDGQPDFRPELPAARVEELSKKLRKVLSRKERKALTLAGANFAMAGVDLGLWRDGMELTIQRVGLLCSGDIKASVDELMEQDDDWMSLDSPPIYSLLMFALYLVAYGGVASFVSKIKNKTTLMLTISLIAIVNLFLGAMLIDLPSVGFISSASYILPSRWLSSMGTFGFGWSLLGMLACAVVYSALPFLLRKKAV